MLGCGTSGLAALAAAQQRVKRCAAEDSSPQFPPGRFVDIHTHLGRIWNSSAELTVDGLLAWMDATEVAQAAVLPLVSPESASFLLTTEAVRVYLRTYPRLGSKPRPR